MTIECPRCEGSGIEADTYTPATWLTPSEAEPCGRCNGTGTQTSETDFFGKPFSDLIPRQVTAAMIDRAAATMCFWGVMDQPHPACEPHREQAEAMLKAALEVPE